MALNEGCPASWARIFLPLLGYRCIKAKPISPQVTPPWSHLAHRKYQNSFKLPKADTLSPCRLCGRSLTTLGSLHMYMEGGHMRMGLCVVHRKLIEELRQDIAAAFTCLSGLIINKESGEPSSGEILHSIP